MFYSISINEISCGTFTQSFAMTKFLCLRKIVQFAILCLVCCLYDAADVHCDLATDVVYKKLWQTEEKAMRVGLLEDDIAIQEMLLLVLQDEGYTVTNYPNADAWLQALLSSQDSSPIDLLIVDWRLNGSISGTEVIQKIRQPPNLQMLPIILTTAAAFGDTEELQRQHVAFLEKPFAVDDMAKLIRKMVSASPE